MDVGISVQYSWMSTSELSRPIVVLKNFEEKIKAIQTWLMYCINREYNWTYSHHRGKYNFNYWSRSLYSESSPINLEFDEAELRKIIHNPSIHAKDGVYLNEQNIGAYFIEYNKDITDLMRNGMKPEMDISDFDAEKYKVITSEQFLEIREGLKTFFIPSLLWDDNEWRNKIQAIFDLLTGDKVQEDVSMGTQLPKMSMQQAGAVVWYLQEALNIIPSDDDLCFSVCEDCNNIFYSTFQGGEPFCEHCEKTLCYYCHPYECMDEEE